MPLFGHSSQHEQKQKLEAFATLHGLQFAEADAFGLVGLPFPVFSEGHDQGCQNVVYGTWKGLNAWAFVLWTTYRDPDGNDSTSFYTCGAAPLPADCPSIDIHAAGALSRAMRRIGVGGTPVPFESEEFNRKFTVSSAEPKFAFDVVTPDMMAWLLAEGEGWHFEISRNYTLVYRWRESRDVDETAQVLDLITGFYQHIPDVVASLHKLNVQPQPTPEQVMEMAKAAADGFTPIAPGTQVTAGETAAASPEIAAALGQLRAMGIVVPAGTPVEVTTQVETVSPAALTAGHLTITGLQELGTSVGAGRLIQLDADVTPEGGSTYHVTQPAVVMPEHADRVKPGATLAVRIDPSNPAALAIDWDAS